MSRGLVLGAGAHAGYAWVSGLIIGLRRAGVDLLTWLKIADLG
ncbi:hypothetical protein [Actinomadura rayongensis]|nr:hypothetical protein [Actinomadura rayongensis]